MEVQVLTTDQPTSPWSSVALHPVARVFVHYSSGGVANVAVGSGFFVGAWRRCLVTARHIVAPVPGALLRALRVEVKLASGAWWRMYARRAALPAHDEHRDVAVLGFDTARPKLQFSSRLGQAPEEGEIQVNITGWIGSHASDFIAASTTANRHFELLRYPGGGRGGMSGGPIVAATSKRVVGVHMGRPAAGQPQVGCAFDAPLFEQLRQRARNG